MALQHGGQSHQADRNFRCPYHPGGGREQGRNGDCRDPEPPSGPAPQQMHDLKEPFRHPGLFHKNAHEEKEGHGQKGIVFHQAEKADDEKAKDIPIHENQTEEGRDSSQDKGCRVSQKDPQKKACEHQ